MPFRAAHTPAERSEYAQPDIALLLTYLAYYDDGLSMAELLMALTVLQGMGPSAQEDEYKTWLGKYSATTQGEILHVQVSQAPWLVNA